MKIVLILLFVTLFNSYGKAVVKNNPPDSAKVVNDLIYLEILGSAFYHSLNYERLISHGENIELWGRVGCSPISSSEMAEYPLDLGISGTSTLLWMIPFGLNTKYHRKGKSLIFEHGIYLSWLVSGIENKDDQKFIQSELFWNLEILGAHFQLSDSFYLGVRVGALGSVFEVYFNDFYGNSELGKIPMHPSLGLLVGYTFTKR